MSAVAKSTQVRCKQRACTGTIGAWADGSFFPAPHLRPTRDLWLSSEGVFHVRCSMCNSWHAVTREPLDGRLIVRISTHSP